MSDSSDTPPSECSEAEAASSSSSPPASPRRAQHNSSSRRKNAARPNASMLDDSSRQLVLSAEARASLPASSRLDRARLLRTLTTLSPPWQPWRMDAEERAQWFRVGGVRFDAVCHTSRDWCVAGRRFENKRDMSAAAACYSRAIRLNPHCAPYYFRLGCVQCELEEWGGAIESFNIAIVLAPEMVRASYLFNLGFAHSELRQWQEAIDALKKAIALRPNKHVYHNLIVRRQSQTEQSEERCDTGTWLTLLCTFRSLSARPCAIVTPTSMS